MNSIAVVLAPESAASAMALRLNRLEINETISDTKAPTAAASVGVKNPCKFLP